MPIIKCSTEKLTQVALSLYSKKGYHATSIDDIAKAVGIRKASVYHHYPAKEKILESILKDIITYVKKKIFFVIYMKKRSR